MPGDLIVLVAWTFAAASSAAAAGFTDGEGNVYQLAVTTKTGACETEDGVLAMYYAIVTGAPSPPSRSATRRAVMAARRLT